MRDNYKTVLAMLMAVLAVASMAAGPALAASVVQVDGESVSSTDQVNNLVLTEDTSVENATVQFTENQDPSAGGSVVYDTNVTAASATIAAGTDTGNLSVTINDGNITITDETGADGDEVVSTLNVTYNVSTSGNSSGSVTDFINVSEATAPNKTLMEDPDASEVMNYTVVDRYAEADLSVKGVDASFNRSAGDFEVNATGNGQIVIEVTRNNTTYENLSVEDTLRVRVALNNTAFSNIQETTDEEADRITLANKELTNGKTVYVWSIEQPSNLTRNYTITINATVNGGDYNNSVVVGEVHDPVGGQQATYNEDFDHDSVSGAAPQFFEFQGIPLWAFGLGLIGLGFAFVTLYKGKDNPATQSGRMPRAKAYAYGAGWKMFVWLAAFVAGLTMLIDGMAEFVGISFNLWTNLIGMSNLVVLAIGAVLVLISGAMNAKSALR